MFAVRNFFVFPIVFYHLGGYFFSLLRNAKTQRYKIQGRWMRRLFIRLGPLYIKIGQILSTRSDLFPPEIISELQVLQDDIPAMNEKQTRSILKLQYGEKFNEIFTDFSIQPVASASIAQIHAATLKSGQKVAVKVVKKNVRKRMNHNLTLLRFLINVMHFTVPSLRNLNLPDKADELSRLLIDQTHMELEAENQNAIYENFRGHPYVKIPELFPEYCTNDILVMEFVEGIPAKEFRNVDMASSKLAKRLQDLLYTMLYMHGVCHGDPHPGNIFFTKEGKVIFVDFGITSKLSEDEKWGMASFYYAAIRHEWDIAARRFIRYFTISKTDLEKNTSCIKKLRETLCYHFDTISAQWSTANFLRDINAVLCEYHAQFTAAFTKAELAMTSCEGFASQLDPSIDIWDNARKFCEHYSPYLNKEVEETFNEYFSKTIPLSLEMRERGKKSLVASTHLDRYFLPSAYPLFVKSADQGKITDIDGNTYVDLSCGYGPHILGYGHPSVTEALQDAIHSTNLNAIGHESEIKLAEMLVEAFPAADKAIFSNSGTEAVMHALRICRANRSHATRVAKFEGHYHGFSDQAMVSSWFRVQGPVDRPEPIAGCPGTPAETVNNTLVLQFGHPESFRSLKENADDITCVIIEPSAAALGESELQYMRALRKLCTDLCIPLIFDEVVTGFRFAYGGVQVLSNIDPDLTCLGKIIGGGLPCGAVVGKKEMIDIGKTSGDPFLDYEERVFLGGTMSGNYLTCRAGIAVLTHLKNHPEIYDKLSDYTDRLVEQLLEIGRRHKVPLRVVGNRSVLSILFSHRETKYFRDTTSGSNFKASTALAYYMRKHDVYMPEMHTCFLNAMHTEEDLKTMVDAFDKSIQEMIQADFFVF